MNRPVTIVLVLIQAGRRRLERLVTRITEGRSGAVLPCGRVSLSLSHRPQPPGASNMTREQYLAGVAAAQVGIARLSATCEMPLSAASSAGATSSDGPTGFDAQASE